jgi:hypothetical protein
MDKEQKAKEEYQLCLLNLVTLKSNHTSPQLRKLTLYSLYPDQASAYGAPVPELLAVQQPQCVSGRACGNPLFAVVANRLAHLHQSLGEPTPPELLAKASVVFKLYPLPEESKMYVRSSAASSASLISTHLVAICGHSVQSLFLEDTPLILQQIAEQAGVSVESFVTEARHAAVNRALTVQEGPTDRAHFIADMDTLFAAEVAKFRNVDALFKCAIYASSAIPLNFPVRICRFASVHACFFGLASTRCSLVFLPSRRVSCVCVVSLACGERCCGEPGWSFCTSSIRGHSAPSYVAQSTQRQTHVGAGKLRLTPIGLNDGCLNCVFFCVPVAPSVSRPCPSRRRSQLKMRRRRWFSPVRLVRCGSWNRATHLHLTRSRSFVRN